MKRILKYFCVKGKCEVLVKNYNFNINIFIFIFLFKLKVFLKDLNISIND